MNVDDGDESFATLRLKQFKNATQVEMRLRVRFQLATKLKDANRRAKLRLSKNCLEWDFPFWLIHFKWPKIHWQFCVQWAQWYRYCFKTTYLPTYLPMQTCVVLLGILQAVAECVNITSLYRNCSNDLNKDKTFKWINFHDVQFSHQAYKSKMNVIEIGLS